MSSGVDQIKPVPTGGKEERNIPWSQQVDEASCENLTIGSNDGPSAQTTPKFQYPPFKENNHPSINYKSKKYGRPSYHNSNKDDYNGVAWNGSNFRRPIGENHLVQREQRDRLGNQGNIESLNIQNHNEHKVTAQQPAVTQKKTTWALIASQPAKHTSKVSLTSAQKKKGPGMPPPPMVPGKHDLNASAWDIPSNNPPPVPSPTPHPDISQNENSLHESIQQNSSFRKEENKSIEHLKDDHRNASYRSRNTPGPQIRKSWNQTFPSNNTSRRPMNMDENKFQRKIENNRRNPYVGVRHDQENGGQHVYQKNDYAPDNNTANEMEISSQTSQAVLDELRIKNNYNPATLDMENASCARYFVIKSYSEDDIHRSIKYEIWCSTETGNKRLDDAFKEQMSENGVVLLFFSVNGSGHFCGVAQMMTPVDYNSTASVWSQDKWKGKFKVKWLYVKDVPNSNFRHIKLENNENKPVTHSRDTQEVPNYKGVEVLQIIHSFKHDTSIFDDFHHYEIKQVEGCAKKYVPSDQQSFRGNSPNGRNNHKIIDDRDRDRERDRDRDRDFDRESRGGGTSRHFNNGNMLNYRDRNKAGPQYFQDPKNSSDHLNRYTKKYEPVRRDKVANKHIYKEREQVRDRVKNGNNFRVDLKDSKADNEFEVHR